MWALFFTSKVKKTGTYGQVPVYLSKLSLFIRITSKFLQVSKLDREQIRFLLIEHVSFVFYSILQVVLLYIWFQEHRFKGIDHTLIDQKVN